MTTASKLRVLRTIPLMIVVCFVSFPVKAQYGGGTGEPNDPYLIYTAEQMNEIGLHEDDWDEHFKLMADIDMAGFNYYAALIALDTESSKSGFQGTPFTGVFDGNGYTISHLTIIGGAYLGLFGRLASGAEVKDLGVVDVNITGSEELVGGLVGGNLRGRLLNCYSTGEVSCNEYVGGLVGYNTDDGTLTRCYSISAVNGNRSVGGLVGINYGKVIHCCSAGAVSGNVRVGGMVGYNRGFGHVTYCYSTSAVTGDRYVGGLVGSTSGDLTDCYSTGAIRGNQYVGGLVGINHGNVTYCYSTSAVTGDRYVGGLVGTNYGGHTTVTTCYSTGEVSSNEYVGGLVGSGSGDVTTSYWDIETSGQTTSAGGTGKKTAEMQTAITFLYAGWDFVGETENGTDDIWWILEGQNYPKLVWELWASSTNPQDGAAHVVQPLILSWAPGGDALYHDIYFGEDEEAVTNVTTDSLGIYRGRQAAEMTTYDPGALEWDTTYYWRIDEVNEADPQSPWKGRVWKFTTADFITLPYPTDGATVEVNQPLALSWVPGVPGLQYDVYFGENEDVVANAMIESAGTYRGRQPTEMTTYVVDDLELGQTYYWRIDGIDEADSNNLWKGNIWSFTTADFIVVDDFESYAGAGYAPIWFSWHDGLGYGVPGGYPGNGTGSSVGYETAWPTLEETIVHSGRQSMPFFYDNNKQGYAKYSEATLTLSYPRDWTEGGITTLTLWFYGDPANDSEPMYVAVANRTGTPAVVSHDDPNTARIDTWTEWVIPLQTFVDQGIDLTDLERIAIGFGTKGNLTIPGGSGKMYFDDIRLYRLLP